MPKHAATRFYPSILACDFGHLAKEVQKLESLSVDGIHIDIMDGLFVPNLTMGPSIVAAIKRNTSLPLDVHLMVYEPFEKIEAFIKAGADEVSFHIEACENVRENLAYIRKCNKRAGLSINPETPVDMLFPYLADCDFVLFMTVHPGFGGQEFIRDMPEKIEILKKMIVKEKFSVRIHVDGGIDLQTGQICVDAGADTLISGSYFFHSSDFKQTVNDFKGLAKKHT